MEKFVVSKIEKDLYTFKSEESGKEYKSYFTFYDLKRKLKEGDILAMHPDLFNPDYKEFSMHYFFGPVDEKYGRNKDALQGPEVIGIKVDKQIIYLKRFFG